MPEQNSEPNPAKFRGVPVYMDGREWIVPSLSVRQFRDNFSKLTQEIGTLSADNFVEKLDEMLPLILLAFKRNYPDVTNDQLLDMIDLGSFPEIIHAIAKASGMRAAKPGE